MPTNEKEPPVFERMDVVFHPSRFQSSHRAGAWFEGWYFKLVDPDGSCPVAVIPGMSNDPAGGTSHSFVQLLRPGRPVAYHRYAAADFESRTDRFEVRVGPNRFSSEGIELDLAPLEGQPPVSGRVAFGPLSEWPVTLLSPGIMGWYRYVPRMECYHGVVSMDHELMGHLAFGESAISYDGGRGYSEKDWGTSFPSSWLWAQCNRFEDRTGKPRPGVSLTCSVARIPWLGSSFTGHIAGLLLDTGELLRFATYTGAKLTRIETHGGTGTVEIRDRHHTLIVHVSGATTGDLKAPVQGAMVGRAEESVDARVNVELLSRDGVELFSGTGTAAGVEIMNQKDELSPG